MPATTPLSDLTLRSARRALITGALVVAVLVLFWVMVAQVLLAALLGAVVAIYLRPVYAWLAERTGRPTLAAVLTQVLLFVPAVAVLAYGYLEVRGAAEYLQANAASVAGQIQDAVARLPFASGDIQASTQALLESLADRATSLPAGVQGAIGDFGVAAAVFLFTAVYVLTDADEIVGWLRAKVPARYAGLTERLESNARGVLYGSIYATVVTQSIKGVWILALMLVFGVPLPFTLALIAFLIGFFPVVGSWTVYLPAAGYVLVFQDAPLKALALVVVAFVVSTPILSLYVRPKLAADRSQVLNFYWMFVGLIAGVYTFGIPGIVLGPLTIGLLKALIDVVTDPDSWEPPDEADGHDPHILVEEEMSGESPGGS
ncbi:AI-2E family transporter [Rubrivirga sp. IMCC45206]|uniref:AI-2E family transporter n=1 Tax=Rubrivirga sp. IMCC45206 TaxID=3391614 RepID=UPI00398FC244